MKQLIKKFHKSDANICLLSMPVGFGKTYSYSKYCFEYFHGEEDGDEPDAGKDERIFIITPALKNLEESYKQLHDFYENRGLLDVFNEEVLLINSNSSCLKDNFKKIEKNRIPKSVKESQEYRNIELFVSGKAKLEDRRINDVYRTFYEQYEPAFRRLIYRLVRKSFLIFKGEKENSKKSFPHREIEKFVKSSDEWSWVTVLYPQSLIHEKKIILLSMKMWCCRCSPVITSSFSFPGSELTKKSLIIMDEFDSCKATMLDGIIEESKNQVQDLASFLVAMKNGFSSTPPVGLLMDPKSSEKQKTSQEIWNSTKEMLNKLFDDCNLQYKFKLDDSLIDSVNGYLFHDDTTINVLNKRSEKKDKKAEKTDDEKASYRFSVETDEKERINRIVIDLKSVDPYDKNTLIYTVNNLRGSVNYCTISVTRLAQHLFLYNQENNKPSTYENAIHSIINALGIRGSDADFLFEAAGKTPVRRKSGRLAHTRNYLNPSFYDSGFSYTILSNSDDYMNQTLITTDIYHKTPENMLVDMCLSSKVLGVSATANIPSVTANFSLQYLRDNLKFYEIPSEDSSRIRREFEKHISGYRDVSIITKFIDPDQTGKLSVWQEMYENGEYADEALNMIGGHNKTFIEERYLRFGRLTKEFLTNKEIRTLLTLFNCHADATYAFSEKILRDLFDNMVYDIGFSEENCPVLVVLKTKNNDGLDKGYEEKKKEINDLMRSGKKVMLLSTYPTAGAGQNYQYETPEDELDNLISVNSRGNGKTKDIDAIYLDCPTNVIANINLATSRTELLKSVFQIECLHDNYEMTAGQKSHDIKSAFLRMDGMYSAEKSEDSRLENICKKSDLPSIKAASSRTVIQAIGRICRTSKKKKNIYIFADSKIITAIDPTVLDGELVNPEIKAFMNEVKARHTEMMLPDIGKTISRNEMLAERASRLIKLLYHHERSEEKMHAAKTLRDFVLRNPQLFTMEPANPIAKNFYMQLDNSASSYFYTEENDYDRIRLVDETDLTRKECSEEDSHLPIFMKIDYVKNFFEKKGFATTFKEAPIVMSPALYNNIYKGAIGEQAGYAILDHCGENGLKEIDDVDKYELFDFQVGNLPVYIDFKNWSGERKLTSTEIKELINWTKEKANAADAKLVIICNLYVKDGNKYKIYRHTEENSLEILEVPYLIKDGPDGNPIIDAFSVNYIRNIINEYENHYKQTGT